MTSTVTQTGLQPKPRLRRMRSDARKNEDAVLEAAKLVFASAGVDAPVREIAARAGVGVATLYRRFPKRSDLIVAIFCREVDNCADEADHFANILPPAEALERWLLRYTEFIATKRGLASALRSGDPAYESLPGYFQKHFEPALQKLLDAADVAGAARNHVTAYDILRAIGNLSTAGGQDAQDHVARMVSLLIDGLLCMGTLPGR